MHLTPGPSPEGEGLSTKTTSLLLQEKGLRDEVQINPFSTQKIL